MKRVFIRIIAMLIVLCISCVSMSSCLNGLIGNGGQGDNQNSDQNGGQSGDEKPTNFVLAEKGNTVNIVVSTFATDVVIEAVEMIEDALAEHGILTNRVLDISSPTGKCIYVGNTVAAATETAKAYAQQNCPEGYLSYVIHTVSGALAVYAEDDSLYVDAAQYLISTYLTSSTLTLPDDSVLYMDKVSEDEFDVEWESRWDRITNKYGEEITASMKRIYAFYGDSLYEWIANLYDIENGGFYYSNSARDYEGFLPDIESTTQALWFMTALGLTSHLKNDLTVALPEEIVEQTLEFAYSLYDESDGYFYHPQWGKNIGSARKGRDINSAISVIQKLGGTVPENHALDRLKGDSTTEAAVAKVKGASEVSAVSFLSSESALLAWLEQHNINKNSHGAGHTIESSASQIRAAGYGPFVLEWLDSKQLETGLWEELDPKNPYSALSGILKIGSCYKSLGGQMKKCDTLVETAIDTILSDVDPYIVIYVYNPWGALKHVLNNIKSANDAAKASGQAAPYDYDAEFAKIIEAFPDMIDVTIDKLNKFRKDDGSFSYYQSGSDAYTQGTHVSLGVREGDVNGTSIAVTTMYTTLLDLLGMGNVPLYNEDDYNEFIEIITTLEHVEKIPRPEFAPVDFSDGNLGMFISKYSTVNDKSTIAVEEEGDEGNKALHVVSPSGVGDQIRFNTTSATQSMVSFAIEFDMKMVSASSYSHQISLLNSASAIAVMMTVHCSGDTIIFKDTCSNSHSYGAYTFSETAKLGEWFHLRMEYHMLDSGEIRFVLYVNETYAGESSNYYGKFDSSGNILLDTPKTDVKGLQIYSMMSANNEFYLDNFYYDFSAVSTY